MFAKRGKKEGRGCCLVSKVSFPMIFYLWPFPNKLGGVTPKTSIQMGQNWREGGGFTKLMYFLWNVWYL